jgi:hypothetical protein
LRKFIPLCIALALVAANGAMSQGIAIGDGTLTLGGKIVSGIFFDSDTVPMVQKGTVTQINNKADDFGKLYYGADGRVRLWNETDSKNPLRFDFSLMYVLNNLGFKARLRADNVLQGISGASSNSFARYAYAWIGLLDERIKVTGGFIDLGDNVWGTKGDGDWDIGGNGLRLEIKPLEGLDLGAFLIVPNQNGKPPTQPKNTVNTGYVTLDRVLRETAFGFRYTCPAFYVSSQLKLDSDIDGLIIDSVATLAQDYMEPWSGADDEMMLMFGAGLTAVPGLTLSVEGKLEGLGNPEARGRTDLRQTASYDFGRLTVGAKAKEILYGYDLAALENNYNELGPWMQFKPFAQYELADDFVIGLEGGYGFGYSAELIPDGDNDGKGPAALAVAKEKYDAFIKPSLSLKLAGGLSLRAWYMFTSVGYDDLWDGAAYDNRKLSTIPMDEDNATEIRSIDMHQLALEFSLSF